MIVFENPAYLLFAIPLLFLPRILAVRGRKGGRFGRTPFSSLFITKKVAWWGSCATVLPRYALYGALLLGIVALANPKGEIVVRKQVARGYRVSLGVDISGSMAGDSIQAAKNAILGLITERKLDVFAVLPFGTTVQFPSGTLFTTDLDLIEQTVLGLKADGGATAVGDGIIGSLWQTLADIYLVNNLSADGITLPPYDAFLKFVWNANASEREEFLRTLKTSFPSFDGAFSVIVTDGESNTGVDPVKAANFAGRLGMAVYIIGIGVSPNDTLKKALQENGGAYLMATSPHEIAALYKAISNKQPMIVSVVNIPEQVSYRPQIFLLIALCLLAALIVRSVYLVIE